MEKRENKLFLNKQSHVRMDNVIKEFRFVFYEEMVEMNAEFNGLFDQVDIKAYRLSIIKTIKDAETGKIEDMYERDMGVVCSRSGEVAYTIAQLRKLDNLAAMEEKVLQLTVDYVVSMQKDAFRALKKKLGLNSAKRYVDAE